MSDARNKSGEPTTTCSWCSAVIPVDAAKCPSCGAALRDGVDGDVAGVTQVDLAATSRLARMKPPGRIAMWLGAEKTTDDPALSGRIEPPSDEVRKEMLRLELAAIDAEIEAKNALLEAERSLPPEDGATPAPTAPAPSAPAAPAAPDVAPEAARAGSPEDASGSEPG